MAAKFLLISRKTVIIFSLIVIVVILGIVGVSYLKNYFTVSTAKSDETVYDNMYSCSRYFFRIGYPDEWTYDADQYGFYLDEGTNQVVELYPHYPVNLEEAEDEEHIVYEKTDGVSIKIYHFPIENDDLQYTAKDFMDEILEEYGSSEKYVFGKTENFTTENVKMQRVKFEYSEEEVAHKCCLYTATRRMCKYVIVTDCTAEKEKEYKTEIDKMIGDFRFSVFKD